MSFLNSSSVFLAFGAGVSHCPGRRFARNELKILLVHILARLNIVLDSPHVPEPKFLASRAGIGVFPPDSDVAVHIRLRQ
jgi:cytochrome P450